MSLKKHREGQLAGYPDPGVPPEEEGEMAPQDVGERGGAAYRDEARKHPEAGRHDTRYREAFQAEARRWNDYLQERTRRERKERK